MKFYKTLTLAAILFTATATAQHVNIGIKAGLNLTNINNSNNAEYDSKAGLHAGFIGHIHLSKQLAFQPELVYSSEGAKYTTAGVVTKLNLNYINVPLLLQYMFDNGFRLQAGPQVGFLIGAKSKTNNITIDFEKNLKPVAFAIGAGIGYINPASGLGIDARYNIGLSNINENSSVKSTNRGFQLGLFYLFKHK